MPPQEIHKFHTNTVATVYHAKTPSTYLRAMNPIEEHPLERCADLWYNDGTVVLQAENMLFKVYRGILEEQSPFFADLFTLPQRESNESEKYEDCPLVPMTDPAADVRVFLKAIFDYKFYSDVKTITDYNMILSVVKLSHKYQIDHLLRHSLPTFTAVYPPSLKNWDIREGRRQYKPLTAAYGKALPIFVIELARTTGIDVLLPSALFECCSLSINEIMYGVPTPDGTVLCLEARDQVLILQARERLSQLFRTKVFAFVYSEDTLQSVAAAPAPYSAPARRANWRKVHEWVQGVSEPGCWADPLTRSFPWDAFKIAYQGQRAYQIKQREFSSARQAVWSELPVIFNLLPWDKMKRDSLRK
ncbi:hypothetical protein PHLGIDRAFT_37291 [Phlebiopsis gigantea 11061_1 CR5-6]|uniref:BTB domain-containing protein n=1 Tax=Phlebiopsis gigantea (strain 11061_1 CR5-6) TaxID=745531 RepID=A0A0C3S293_PHLG1|nr:hypothetical protein PHLGIDRAFT_37291 [Phlebiopsis gigantea 11061_1 CR5-6]